MEIALFKDNKMLALHKVNFLVAACVMMVESPAYVDRIWLLGATCRESNIVYVEYLERFFLYLTEYDKFSRSSLTRQ